MSETQLKVTGTFQVKDAQGKQHTVTEYTLYRHTSDADMVENSGGETKEYHLGSDQVLKPISENEFEIVSDGTRLFKS